ncbi:MAG: efflux RND transporter periplasmic adaptor subunit [Chloroflexota bacterium]
MIDFIKRKKKIVIPVAVVLVLLALFLVFRPRSSDPAAQFQIAPVERGDLTATVGATGTVRARQSATLIWQTSGTVEDVNVNVGDAVKAGDVLASLSKTSLPQTIILAEAELVSAQRALDDLEESDTARAQAWIALRNAREAFEKAYDYREALNYQVERTEVRMVTEIVNGIPVQVPKTKSYKSKATPEEIEKADADLALKQAQYEDAKRAYDRVENGPNADDLEAAQARVDAAQATLNLARLTAPFAGTVTEALPLPGDQVSTGALAFRVDDLRSLLVDVELSEVDINSVTVGQTVSLTFDAILGKEYQGEVTKVAQAGTVVSGVVNFTVTVELTEPDELVKPGMTAAVNIVVKEIKDAVLVPNRAVRLVDGDRVVFIMGEDGKPKKVEIRLGSSSDTMSVVLGGDLKEGDQILLNPTADLTGSGPPFAR